MRDNTKLSFMFKKYGKLKRVMQKNKPFSIIVLNHNNKYIDYCIESIKKHKESFDEIIIIDDHSTTKNYKLLYKHVSSDCSIIQNQDFPHNLSYSRNLGAKYAKHELLLFLDGDAFVYNDCINQLRKGLDIPQVVCTTTYVSGMKIAPLQLELVYKENFIQYINNNSLNILENKFFINDYRKDLPISSLQGEHNWIYFLGICLAVKRDAYQKAGLFDENLSGWGIEDIDFTFRLRKYGKLMFIPETHLFHIPHKRDRYKNYEQNAYNNMECVKKYEGNIEWELSYKISSIHDAVSVINRIIYNHKNINYQLPLPDKQNVIYINAISSIFPNGKIIAYDNSCKEYVYKHLGINIPFKNKQFIKCYLSMYIFNYPAPMISMLLQEACRIAKFVLVPKIILKTNVSWDKNVEKMCKPRTLRFETFPVKLSDFIFEEKINYYSITTSLPDTPFKEDRGSYYEFI